MTVLRANVNRQLTSPTPLDPPEDNMASLYDKFEFTSPDGSRHSYTYAHMIGNLFAHMFYGSNTEPWTSDSGVSLLRSLQPGIEHVRHAGQVAAFSQMAADASRHAVTQLDALAETIKGARPVVDLNESDLDQLVSRLKEFLPPSVTPEMIEQSVRRVFSDAGKERTP